MPCYDHAVLLKVTAQHGRRETALWATWSLSASSGYYAEFHEIFIRNIPVLLTTIHTYGCKEW
jgi:hypothetical protein